MTRNFVLWRMAIPLVGIPLLFKLVYAAGYRSLFPSDWDLVWLATCVVAGVWLLYRLPFATMTRRVAVCGVYAVAMGAVLLALSLVVACGKGNCL
jgi:hypothetical protein